VCPGHAGEWKLPVVKFDSAAIFDKYIGETEKRIQKVFKVAEGLAPCVLWIDELEKVFAGTGADSASVDAGVSSRMLDRFWVGCRTGKAPVFVAATSNNVNALPPELIRKAEFDELFFVDLPNQVERKQILSIQLERRKRNLSDFDLDQIAQAARGYSGAEIDAAVQTAMYTSFSFKQPMTTKRCWTRCRRPFPLRNPRGRTSRRYATGRRRGPFLRRPASGTARQSFTFLKTPSSWSALRTAITSGSLTSNKAMVTRPIWLIACNRGPSQRKCSLQVSRRG